MKFGDVLDKYVVLKLPLHDYKTTAGSLQSHFRIAGCEVREIVRKDEKRLLKLYFRRWAAPYLGNLKGWRKDSPIYVLYKEKLVSGLFLCDQNEFNEGMNWGQLHYFFTDPAFKRRGLHSILVREAIKRAKSWRLKGLIINTDRQLVAELYVRWGAVRWKEIKKVRSHKKYLTSLKSRLKSAVFPVSKNGE